MPENEQNSNTPKQPIMKKLGAALVALGLAAVALFRPGNADGSNAGRHLRSGQEPQDPIAKRFGEDVVNNTYVDPSNSTALRFRTASTADVNDTDVQPPSFKDFDVDAFNTTENEIAAYLADFPLDAFKRSLDLDPNNPDESIRRALQAAACLINLAIVLDGSGSQTEDTVFPRTKQLVEAFIERIHIILGAVSEFSVYANTQTSDFTGDLQALKLFVMGDNTPLHPGLHFQGGGTLMSKSLELLLLKIQMGQVTPSADNPLLFVLISDFIMSSQAEADKVTNLCNQLKALGVQFMCVGVAGGDSRQIDTSLMDRISPNPQLQFKYYNQNNQNAIDQALGALDDLIEGACSVAIPQITGVPSSSPTVIVTYAPSSYAPSQSPTANTTETNSTAPTGSPTVPPNLVPPGYVPPPNEPGDYEYEPPDKKKGDIWFPLLRWKTKEEPTKKEKSAKPKSPVTPLSSSAARPPTKKTVITREEAIAPLDYERDPDNGEIILDPKTGRPKLATGSTAKNIPMHQRLDYEPTSAQTGGLVGRTIQPAKFKPLPGAGETTTAHTPPPPPPPPPPSPPEPPANATKGQRKLDIYVSLFPYWPTTIPNLLLQMRGLEEPIKSGKYGRVAKWAMMLSELNIVEAWRVTKKAIDKCSKSPTPPTAPGR